MAVTIRDVAAAAGVSTATVSHVFNATRFVAPETAERVREAAKQLGYIPSINACSKTWTKSHYKGRHTHSSPQILLGNNSVYNNSWLKFFYCLTLWIYQKRD